MDKVKKFWKSMRTRRVDMLVLVLLLVSLPLYLYNLGGWLGDGDEGNYLYAAWQLSGGNAPYRDFLTPQLPLFLYAGALLFRLFGVSLSVARASTVVSMLLAAGFLYAAAKRVFNARVGAVGALIFLMHDDVYRVARQFRPEAYMLLFTTAGVYAVIRSFDSRRRWGLAVAGVLFALGTSVKLFAVLPFAACGLLLVLLMIRREATAGLVLINAAWLALPFAAMLGLIFGLNILLSQIPAFEFLDLVVGHHLKQGSGLAILQVIGKGLHFYGQYASQYPLFIVLALLGALLCVFTVRNALQLIYPLQILTIFSFLGLSRSLYDHHALYLLPALCTTFAFGVDKVWRGVGQAAAEGTTSSGSARSHSSLRSLGLAGAGLGPAIAVIMIGGVIYSPLQANWDDAMEIEQSRLALTDYIQAQTTPDDRILVDYPGILFFARRGTTYSGGSFSTGAMTSGQITGSRLVQEMAQDPIEMILMRPDGGEWKFMRDYHYFRSYVHAHYHYVRDFQVERRTLHIYRAGPPTLTPLNTRFGDQLRLTGYALEQPNPASGDQLYLILAWRAEPNLNQDLKAFVHVTDLQGHVWSAYDQTIWDVDGRATSQWARGDENRNGYVVPIQDGTPPGVYQVRVGLYKRDVPSQRLSYGGADLAPAGTEYILGSFEVAPSSVPLRSPVVMEHQVDANLAGQMRLMGYTLGTDRIRPGSPAVLTLLWAAQRDMTVDYELRLTIRDDEGHAWAETTSPVVSASYPTTAWREGEVLLGRYDLITERRTPPGAARIGLNLLNSRGRPLLAEDLVLARVQIEDLSRSYTVPEIEYPLSTHVGEQILLLGYALDRRSVQPGEELKLTLYWQARAEMKTSYTVFTHLIDAQQHIWGQKDSVPLGGGHPTTAWLPGEVIVDTYDIPVKAGAPPGEYSLEIGLYDAQTMERLPIVDEAGKTVANRVLLPHTVTVR